MANINKHKFQNLAVTADVLHWSFNRVDQLTTYPLKIIDIFNHLKKIVTTENEMLHVPKKPAH